MIWECEVNMWRTPEVGGASQGQHIHSFNHVSFGLLIPIILYRDSVLQEKLPKKQIFQNFFVIESRSFW